MLAGWEGVGLRPHITFLHAGIVGGGRWAIQLDLAIFGSTATLLHIRSKNR
jgi:hypothetical protein